MTDRNAAGILQKTMGRGRGVIKPARFRHTFLFQFQAIAGRAAAAGVMIHENHGHKRVESPDRPWAGHPKVHAPG